MFDNLKWVLLILGILTSCTSVLEKELQGLTEPSFGYDHSGESVSDDHSEEDTSGDHLDPTSDPVKPAPVMKSFRTVTTNELGIVTEEVEYNSFYTCPFTGIGLIDYRSKSYHNTTGELISAQSKEGRNFIIYNSLGRMTYELKYDPKQMAVIDRIDYDSDGNVIKKMYSSYEYPDDYSIVVDSTTDYLNVYHNPNLGYEKNIQIDLQSTYIKYTENYRMSYQTSSFTSIADSLWWPKENPSDRRARYHESITKTEMVYIYEEASEETVFKIVTKSGQGNKNSFICDLYPSDSYENIKEFTWGDERIIHNNNDNYEEREAFEDGYRVRYREYKNDAGDIWSCFKIYETQKDGITVKTEQKYSEEYKKEMNYAVYDSTTIYCDYTWEE